MHCDLLGCRVKAAALFLLAVTCYMVATLFGGEALLACVAMGLYAANSSRDSHRLQADRDVVEGCLNCIMPGVNVAFFSLAGAGLQLDALASTVHIAVVVFVVRGAPFPWSNLPFQATNAWNMYTEIRRDMCI